MPQTTATVNPAKTVELTVDEISFYDHEIYAEGKLIAKITYDQEDFVTQPWIVEVNGVGVFRHDTWASCYRYIQWHHQDGTLPVQGEEAPITTTGNEVMARIAQACEALGYELRRNGIYHNDVCLKEIVYKNGTYHYVQSLPPQQESVGEALDWLFDQITAEQWESLEVEASLVAA